MTIQEVETIFQARQSQGFHLVITIDGRGEYACLVRRGSSGNLSDLNPGRPRGFSTILEAVQDTDSRINSIITSRRETEAMEIVDTYIRHDRLRKEVVTIDGESVTNWVARDDSGNWSQPMPSPRAAYRESRKGT